MTNIIWKNGSAFDLFVSLSVLTDPERYGLRPTWAAGVRSRLTNAERQFLEDVQAFILVPMGWLMNLKSNEISAPDALDALRQLPAEERLAALTISGLVPEDVRQILIQTEIRGEWNSDEQALVKGYYRKRNIHLNSAQMECLQEAWLNPKSFGEQYLSVLRSYYQAFFAEDEKHILPALASGLAFAKAAEKNLPPERLLETLSKGVQFEEYFQANQLPEFVLAPSYWSSPLIFVNRISQNRVGVVFGCRDDGESIVPGEAVPPMVVARLKALSDPTRLRILRYLAAQPMSPSQLAKKLRLRAPTVVHHLNHLRLAGLVQIILLGEEKRRYAFRLEGTEDAFQGALGFILGEQTSGKSKTDGS